MTASAGREGTHRLTGRSTARGFTLVELLVVVAIIAMLISIIMPGLGRAKAITRVTICSTGLSVAGRGVNMYMQVTESPEAWRWSDGGYDLPWEWARGTLDDNGRLVRRSNSWGNPAIALTKDFGRSAPYDEGLAPHSNPQNFVDSAKAFFCPLAVYTYEQHYRRNGLEGLPLDSLPYLWGTYQYNFHIDRDYYGNERPDAVESSRKVVMLDYTWYGARYAWEQYQPTTHFHYNALMLDGSVKRLSDKTKDAWEWLFGPQPSAENEVRDFSRVHYLAEGTY